MILYRDGDSVYIGMNRSSGDVIDVYFVNKELNGFKWLDNRRPKNKLELFE